MTLNYAITRNWWLPKAFTANNERQDPPLLATARLSVAVASNGFLAVWSTIFQAEFHHIGEYLPPPLAFGIPLHERVFISTELVRISPMFSAEYGYDQNSAFTLCGKFTIRNLEPRSRAN